MRLSRLKVKNFRSIEEIEIKIDSVTRIIGSNGAGKSTLLKALELFYVPSVPPISPEDYFNRDQSREIEITLTFDNLGADDQRIFASRLNSSGSLVVARVFCGDSKLNGKFFGQTYQFKGFQSVRRMDKANDKRAAYGELQTQYTELANVASAAEIETNLTEWEENNQEKCEFLRDDGQFFGFSNVAQGKLSNSTVLVYIPAVRDASIDAAEGKGSAVTKLLDFVVRTAIESRPDLITFRNDFTKKFQEIMNPANLSELGGLANTLTSTLKSFYSDTDILLDWKEMQPISIPMPVANLALDDGGFVTAVERTGHGLQRALILTLLQHLAIALRTASDGARDSEPEQASGPSLVLAIEEPELYQHPTKQRHFAYVLESLAERHLPGVARETQVIFTTHSPLFIQIQRFEEVRLVRRRLPTQESLRDCIISTTNLSTIASKLTQLHQASVPFSEATLRPRLHTIDGVVSEGLFADVVVLVEGPSDRAALLACALLDGKNLMGSEIAVIGVGGKSCLDKPYLIFQELGIPVYMIWDCDQGGSDFRPEQNRVLQRIAGVPEVEIMDSCTRIERNFTCFTKNIEDMMKGEIEETLWNSLLDGIGQEYGVSRKDAQKIPTLMTELLRRASEKGAKSSTLQRIIENIYSLKAQRGTKVEVPISGVNDGEQRMLAC